MRFSTALLCVMQPVLLHSLARLCDVKHAPPRTGQHALLRDQCRTDSSRRRQRDRHRTPKRSTVICGAWLGNHVV